MIKSFQSSFTNFSVVCEVLVCQLGIYTLEELRESPFYDSYFTAAYYVAAALVKSPAYRSKVQSLNLLQAYSDEDTIQDITILFVEKYTKIIHGMINYRQKHSHKSYLGRSLSNSLYNVYKKYSYETGETNDQAKPIRKLYCVSSLNNSVADEEECGSFFIDLIADDGPTPEESFIKEELDRESVRSILYYMHVAANHKNKGEVFALMLFGLRSIGFDEKITEIANTLCETKADDISSLYRSYLIEYNDSVLHLDEKELTPFLGYTNEDFGNIDPHNPQKLAAELARWNNRLRDDLKKAC